MKNALLIDLGGTNVRHAFFLQNNLSVIKKEKISDENFIPFLSRLIDEEEVKIDYLVIAAAGPNNQKSINLTNRDLIVNVDELEINFNLKKCLLLNDWEAVAYSLDQLDKESFLKIRKSPSSKGNTLLVGPGTGLGVTLILDNKIIPTEFGNTLSPTKKMLENFGLERSINFTSIESILSGPGIQKLYEEKFKTKLCSEEIIKSALEGSDNELFVVENFLKTLIGIINDLVLTFSIERVVLGGGILNSLKPLLISTQNYFSSEINPKYSHLAKKTQVSLLLEDEPGIFGCLALLKKT